MAPGPQPPVPLHPRQAHPPSSWLPLSFPTQLPDLPLPGQVSLDNLPILHGDPRPHGHLPGGDPLLLLTPKTPSVWAPWSSLLPPGPSPPWPAQSTFPQFSVPLRGWKSSSTNGHHGAARPCLRVASPGDLDLQGGRQVIWGAVVELGASGALREHVSGQEAPAITLFEFGFGPIIWLAWVTGPCAGQN